MREWALQDAKARLSEVVRLAMEHEPQEITLRGEPAVVVLSREDYDRLTQRRESLVEFMRCSPLYGADDVEFSRDQSLTREVEL
ncbi:type II toxin-antitoxin system Phd/YefM family antitoxin [Methylococcus capsulatus]|uniref:Antitoxin n=2 Tax=Methylococcaceae TaxID=403 RepID=A0ABZ2F9Y3_METCP|nr:type II toxin-antitoxin system Phd/YefM family antitoxin [Methylococcus capsulatus]